MPVGIFPLLFLDIFSTKNFPVGHFPIQNGLEHFPENSATSGSLFSGEKFRNFEKFEKFYKIFLPPEWFSVEQICPLWFVVTTISPKLPEGVSAAASYDREKACLVVVGDFKGPFEIWPEFKENSKLLEIKFLSFSEQISIENDFFKLFPKNNFGRKNFGYLFAMAKGAVRIFDLDDDNILYLEKTRAASATDFLSFNWTEKTVNFIEVDKRGGSGGMKAPEGGLGGLSNDDPSNDDDPSDDSFELYNHYSGLALNFTDKIWPRGLPLDRIFNKNIKRSVLTNFSGKISVLQSLSDRAPDLDAVFRLTNSDRDFFYFDAKDQRPTILSHSVMAPFNAQACLVDESVFFALFLPVTVHGRVSDIFRSFIVQIFLERKGLFGGFFGDALVYSDRNFHNYLGDLKAEIGLFLKVQAFLKSIRQFAKENKNEKDDLVFMEKLYIDLYEKGFVEAEDVELVKLWTLNLQFINEKKKT